jgi:hypothetical protein
VASLQREFMDKRKTKLEHGLSKRKESKAAIIERGGRWRQPGRSWIWCGADSLAGASQERFHRQRTTVTSVVDTTTISDAVDNDTDRRLSVIGWSQTTNRRSHSLTMMPVVEETETLGAETLGAGPANKTSRSESKINAFSLKGTSQLPLI